MRKRTINPCSMKGETWGYKKSDGWPEPVTRPVYWTPCECMRKWTSVRPGLYGSFSFGLEREVAGNEAGQTIRLPENGSGISENYLVTLPCAETFRNVNSQGTRLYRKLTGSKFPGCKLLEERLLSTMRIRVEPIAHFLGLTGFLVDALYRSQAFRGAQAGRILNYYGDKLCFLLDVILVEERRQAYSESLNRSISSPLAEFMAASPLDAKKAQMRRLIDTGNFNHDPKLKSTAWLISRGYTGAEEILDVMPAFPVSEFASLQSRVYVEVQKTLPKRLKKFPSVWASLSKKQRHTIKYLFMKGIGLTHQRYAKLIKISRDSVKDRIDGAFKKFEKGYPELKSIQAQRREQLAMTIAPMESDEKEPNRNGPVVHFNPKTLDRREIECNPIPFRREMIKPGADVRTIAEWARDRAPKQRFH